MTHRRSNEQMLFILTNIDEYAQNTISDEEGAFDLTELKRLLKEKVSAKTCSNYLLSPMNLYLLKIQMFLISAC